MSEEEESLEEPIVDSKGNRLDYEASAFARPRTKGVYPKTNALDDRTSGHD